MGLFLIGFVSGCFFTYLILYLPSKKLHEQYQERLEKRLKKGTSQ